MENIQKVMEMEYTPSTNPEFFTFFQFPQCIFVFWFFFGGGQPILAQAVGVPVGPTGTKLVATIFIILFIPPPFILLRRDLFS